MLDINESILKSFMKNASNYLAAFWGQCFSNGEQGLVSSGWAESPCFAPVLLVQGLGELVWQRTGRNSHLGVPRRVQNLLRSWACPECWSSPSQTGTAMGNGLGRDFVNLRCSSWPHAAFPQTRVNNEHIYSLLFLSEKSIRESEWR